MKELHGTEWYGEYATLTDEHNDYVQIEYEKYGSPHQIQLTVTSYVGGNLAIQMVAWEDGYPEPWASLTVNLDGKRQKDCAWILIAQILSMSLFLIRISSKSVITKKDALSLS